MDRFYKPHFEKIDTTEKDPYEEIRKVLEKYPTSEKIIILERLSKQLRQSNSIRINKEAKRLK